MVLITKKETSEDVKQQTVHGSELSESVDTFVESKIEYDDALKSLNPLKKLMEESKKNILDYANANATPTEELTIKGSEHSVEISPKYREAELESNKAIFEAVGIDTFLAIAKVSVTELKKYLTPDELDAVCTYSNTGARRVKVQK